MPAEMMVVVQCVWHLKNHKVDYVQLNCHYGIIVYCIVDGPHDG